MANSVSVSSSTAGMWWVDGTIALSVVPVGLERRHRARMAATRSASSSDMVKIYAWEETMAEKVREVRDRELRVKLKMSMITNTFIRFRGNPGPTGKINLSTLDSCHIVVAVI